MRDIDQKLINVTGGRPDIDGIRQALEAGANIDVQNPENGATCLIETCWFGHLDQFDFLIHNNADPNITDISGDTALSSAIRQGHIKIAERLIALNNINLAIRTFEGKTVLELARENALPDIARIIENKLYKKTIDGFRFETPESVSLTKHYPNTKIDLKEIFDFATRQVIAVTGKNFEKSTVTQFSEIDEIARIERAAKALEAFTQGQSDPWMQSKKPRPKAKDTAIFPGRIKQP